MWALRRASNPLKNRSYSLGSFQAVRVRLETASSYLEDDAELVVGTQATINQFLKLKRYNHSQCTSMEFLIGSHHFSSHAGTKSGGEEDADLDDGFSELENPDTSDTTQANNITHENDDEMVSGHELSEEDGDDEVIGLQNELEQSDTKTDVKEKRDDPKRVSSRLFKAIMVAPGLSVRSALDKWVEEGKDINASIISMVNNNLRKRRMYGRALQLSEWLESSKCYDFSEREYATRVDLIAKLRGLHNAERYIETIPISHRGEVIYRTFLANCVVSLNVRKAEEVFNKMKDLQFQVTAFACNQLLLLYKRLDKKKIADVLLLMEKENVRPTLFTYNLLIDTKGQTNDIPRMEKIVETMKSEGTEPDTRTLSILAKHYISGGLKEKAEIVMKEMEGGDLRENRDACRSLLLLYASLGKADEVSRIWEACQSDPTPAECLSAIEAWGKLKKVENAEAAFETMSKRWKRPTSSCYPRLLRVYADNKMLVKGKDLVKQMANSGFPIGPPTWDALIKLYVEAGELEKADSILQKVSHQNRMKPMFSSYMTVMEQYSRRGDVHNAEKMFHRMRQAGYVARLQQFQSLIQAYINAKIPAYGMKERMKADNIFPNKSLSVMLPLVDAFKKTAASELLD